MNRSHIALLSAVIALSGLPLAAEVCATRADLVEGIVVSYAHGGSDLFTADPRRPGVIRLDAEIEGHRLGTVEFAQGHVYLSAIGPQGQRVRYDYDMLPADIPPPFPGSDWEAVAVVTADGANSTDRQRVQGGLGGTLTLGECIWELVEVTITWSAGEETRYYFPELGLSVPAGDQVTAITPLALVP